MGLFDNIKGQRGTRGDSYFVPGVYEVEINRVKTGKTRKGDDYYVVETNILHSNNSDLPEGASASWMVLFRHESALGNIADFCRAAAYSLAKQNGADPGVKTYQDIEIDSNSAEQSAGEDNPFAGVRLKAEAYNIKTRAGGDFTKLSWTPVE